MSDRELRDWYLYASERPLPDELADVHSALICTIVANLARAGDSAPVEPADFLVLRRRPTPRIDVPADAVVMSEGERFARAMRR